MAFTRNTFQNISASLANSGDSWLYASTTDAAATVLESGYFNPVAQLVDVGHMINASCSDGYKLMRVTSALGVTPVTTAAYVPA